MLNGVMVCGVDCFADDENCNGYCRGLCDQPQVATEEMQLKRLRADAEEKLRLAEKAWYEVFCITPLGVERERANAIYENIRCAKRIG